jgi:hypothetical protein
MRYIPYADVSQEARTLVRESPMLRRDIDPVHYGDEHDPYRDGLGDGRFAQSPGMGTTDGKSR